MLHDSYINPSEHPEAIQFIGVPLAKGLTMDGDRG